MIPSGLPILDLAQLEGPAGSRRGATRRRSAGIAVFGAVAIALLAGTGWQSGWRWPQGTEAPPALRLDLPPAHRIAALTVDDPGQIIAEGGDAAARNARIPFAAGAAVPMRSFLIDTSAATGNSALRCLTQAIYYEAAIEPVEGRRAVAQVVLNRVRHPAYPKSVCGVIYQGAELSTGCQFSFTCDGALLRAPMARPWREAEAIAREALAGRVEAGVGTATHYHADYVLPRWAFEMDKITRLGRHLFYRFEGTWGRPGFFGGVYSAHEVIPALDFSRLRARLLASHEDVPEAVQFTPGLTVAPAATDRHAENDVGGRIDMTREWRLSIPDPVAASSRYRAAIGSEPAASATQGEAAEVTR